jgi:ATP-binding cassette subfamily F protein uup
MDHLVNQLFVFEGNGKIKLFNGNYSDYRASLEDDGDEPEEVVQTVAEKKESTAPRKKVSLAERKEYENLQAEIQEIESRVKSLTDELNSGTGDHIQLTRLAEQIGALNLQSEEKTMRWMELDEKISAENRTLA